MIRYCYPVGENGRGWELLGDDAPEWQLVTDRLRVWQGPPPQSLSRSPRDFSWRKSYAPSPTRSGRASAGSQPILRTTWASVWTLIVFLPMVTLSLAV
jgi:hypothetical protein